MKIFISYSSKYREFCERLCLALEGERHDVFMDRTDLDPGRSFDERLREAINRCDLVIFLVSPESVAEGSYALAELNMARDRWPVPDLRVLPVMVAPTELKAIPLYLRAVTILQPQGEAVAETLAAVAKIDRQQRRWLRVGWWLTPVLLTAMGLGLWFWQQHQLHQRELAASLADLRLQCQATEYGAAWQRFDQIIVRFPDSAELATAREDCAMRWLREIKVRQGEETFTSVVDRVLPTLIGAAARAEGQRAGDLYAHIGWAEWLRQRDGNARQPPRKPLEHALAADPANVYAHTMLGFLDVVSRRSLDDEAQAHALASATTHFDQAIKSEREHDWVRQMQFAALFWEGSLEPNSMALAVADSMRRGGEVISEADARLIWKYLFGYPDLAVSGRLVSASKVPPAELLKTFEWLYPDANVGGDPRNNWRFWHAALQLEAGDTDAGRAALVALRAEWIKAGYNSNHISIIEQLLGPAVPGSAKH